MRTSVIRPGREKAWDTVKIVPQSLLLDRGHYQLFYHASSAGTWQTGTAFSGDLKRWSHWPGNPISADRSSVIVRAGDRHLLYAQQKPPGVGINLYFGDR